jgi:hypothetical protein
MIDYLPDQNPEISEEHLDASLRLVSRGSQFYFDDYGLLDIFHLIKIIREFFKASKWSVCFKIKD